MNPPKIKASKLQYGDKVATVSLSCGGTGTIPHHNQTGKQQYQDKFKLQVVEIQHTLADSEWISRNPEARAEDLMLAFSNPEIKGVISSIGGDDSIRILPFLDLDVIRNNPKVFLGYSDTTITHMDFGHIDPMMTLPYSVQAEIDCDQQQFRIIENAVID